MFGRIIKGLGIVIVTSILATVSIDATDNLGNLKHSMLGAAVFSVIGEPDACGEGMVLVDSASGSFCIDMYEVSAGDECAYSAPLNADETSMNISQGDCSPVSVEGRTPWTNIPQHQAEIVCAKAGKRLPTHAEWYKAALATPDNKQAPVCNIGDVGGNKVGQTGSFDQCVSAWGTYDMVGNVWEWVGEVFTDGSYGGVELPNQGYVQSVDASSGVPTKTGTSSQASFNDDYFWLEREGTRGVFRGGFWGLGDKVGVYAVHAGVTPDFVGVGVGFRCAASVNN